MKTTNPLSRVAALVRAMALGGSFLFITSVNASLSGVNITAELNGSSGGSTRLIATVGFGQEFDFFASNAPGVNIDPILDTITVFFPAPLVLGGIYSTDPTDFWTLSLTDLAWAGEPNSEIIGVDLIHNAFAGTPLIFSTGHEVNITVNEQASDNQELVVAMTISHNVPLPAALPLLGFAIAGLSFHRRKAA